jgi:TM2 domain-containing membrane protein YozV
MREQEYIAAVAALLARLPEERRDAVSRAIAMEIGSGTVALGWSVWLGVFGADRFYLGQVWLGLLKLITLGGFGIWQIVDWFIIARTVRQMNIERIEAIILTLE